MITAAHPWLDVIYRQLGGIELPAAVHASKLVALEDLVASQ